MRHFVFLCSLLLWVSVAEAQAPSPPLGAEKSFASRTLLFPRLEEPKQLSTAYYWYGNTMILGVASGVTGTLHSSTVAELRELSVVSANKMPSEILYSQSDSLKKKKLSLSSGLSLSFAIGNYLGGAFWTKHQAKLIFAPSLYKSTVKLKITF